MSNKTPGNTPGSVLPGWARSGTKGAYKLPSGRYTGQFRYHGKHYSVGSFNSAEEAGEAVRLKREELINRETP